jgi:hypothetical protein
MKVTRTQKWMIFALGSWFGEAQKKIHGSPLLVSVSKIAFIDFLLSTGLVTKHKRALYKNLEVLEKRKWIVYDNRELLLTHTGLRTFEKIYEELLPYLTVKDKLASQDVLKYTKKVQTILR